MIFSSSAACRRSITTTRPLLSLSMVEVSSNNKVYSSSTKSPEHYSNRNNTIRQHKRYFGHHHDIPTRTTTTTTTTTTASNIGSSHHYHDAKQKKEMNMFTAINNAMDIAMASDPGCVLFGEDVGFGGVFRCSQGLREKYGGDRVFNTPLSENGIVGFGIGYASMSGGTAIAEVQFADYIFPAMDQIVNEAAKFRYRSGNQWNCGRITIRAPCGAVGHGGHYHSQSPEAYLCHTPGIKVVMPSTPYTAKGLLLSSIRCNDPVVFLEPKCLYRSSIEEVPVYDDYELPLDEARVVREGTDVTLVGYGGHLHNVLLPVCDAVSERYGLSVEVIDVQTLLPLDAETLRRSVKKTGKCVVSHEAPVTCGYGAEIVAQIQESCFDSLEAPVTRVCGYDTPFPLVFEKYYIPDRYKNIQAILDVMEYAK